MSPTESVITRALDGAYGISNRGEGEGLFRERVDAASTIAVPLAVSGRAVGALCATRGSDRPRFTTSDLASASEFAVQGGLAVALAWACADRQRLDLIEERARIARDLHDNLIQRLFGTGLGLQTPAASTPAHADSIDRHVAEIDAAIADIRTAIFTLRLRPGAPSARHRLLDVVTEFTSDLSAPAQITFSGPVDLIVVDALADDVVAVVREVLSNVARHANATTTKVDVLVSVDAVIITVDDDGDGVPTHITRTSGIQNLRMRARSHGGAFTLERRQPTGTRARWQAPISLAVKP